MRVAFAAPVVASALYLAAGTSDALEWGPVARASRLGQPLEFAVAVKLDGGDKPAPSCAHADVLAGDNPVPASQVRTRLLASPNESGLALARVNTTVRIDEPVVTVQLSLGCPPKLTHKFVSLLDPPTGLAPTGAVRLASHMADKRGAVSALPSTMSSGTASPSAAAASTAAADASASSPESDALAAERARWAEMDQRVEQERQAVQATQQAMEKLQQRLREMELARHDQALLYALGGTVGLLLAAVGILLWRLMRLHSEQAWAAETRTLAQQSGVRSTEPAARPSASMPLYDEATLTSMRVIEPSQAGTTKADAAPPAVREAAQTTSPSALRMRRSLSAEELVDLEQQADFFIALGQEEAAIDLLMGHVRSSGGTSPMPYLKLLDIYRRRGEADAYDRIRERFNRRFNGHAPPWEADPKAGRALESYPETLTQVKGVWSMPTRAVELLEALLFRRDSSAETFELRAYEELLFLYAVARDVLERDVSPDGVDLLLPLGNESHEPAIVRAEATQRLDVNVRTRSSSVDLEL